MIEVGVLLDDCSGLDASVGVECERGNADLLLQHEQPACVVEYERSRIGYAGRDATHEPAQLSVDCMTRLYPRGRCITRDKQISSATA